MSRSIDVLSAARTILPALVVTLSGLIAVAGAEFQGGTSIDELLRRQRFSTSEIRAVNAGQAVVKSLDTPVRPELAHIGVVYVNVPAARFIERFRDIDTFEKGPGVPQIHRFSVPPRIEDLASLELPAKDVADLRDCRPKDCEVNLSSNAMARFTSAADIQRVFREMLLETLQGYQTRGNAALGRYEHHSEPVVVADEFRALLASAQPLPVPVPGLVAYLDTYPGGRPAAAEDLFYWSVVQFGLKPTVRMNHVVIMVPPGKPSGVSHVIAIKQLYASHYFHTTLELRFLVEDPQRSGFYLISLTRSRSDGLTGLTGSLARPIVNRRSRNAVRGYLEYLKEKVERER